MLLKWVLQAIRAILLVSFVLGLMSGLQYLIYPDTMALAYLGFAGCLAGLPWSIVAIFLPDSAGFLILHLAICWAAAFFNYVVVSRRIRLINTAKGGNGIRSCS